MTYTIPMIEMAGAKIEDRTLFDGLQRIYTFDNGYGASIIHHQGSYGLELAVLKNGQLCYDTPLTNDVIGHIKDADELRDYLLQIKALTKETKK